MLGKLTPQKPGRSLESRPILFSSAGQHHSDVDLINRSYPIAMPGAKLDLLAESNPIFEFCSVSVDIKNIEGVLRKWLHRLGPTLAGAG
jgi:hypothetical protein